jgi:phosphocarrier protein
MNAPTPSQRAETISIPIPDPLGLHARPSVKVSKLAKTFQAQVELAKDEAGPWVDAKSVVKVLAVKAPRDTVLHIRAEGADAEAAVAAIADLVARNFDEVESAAAG